MNDTAWRIIAGAIVAVVMGGLAFAVFLGGTEMERGIVIGFAAGILFTVLTLLIRAGYPEAQPRRELQPQPPAGPSQIAVYRPATDDVKLLAANGHEPKRLTGRR